MKYISILIVLAGFTSCSTYSDDNIKQFDKEIQTYLQEHDINCEQSESGLYFKIINSGEGRTIQYQDHVTFKYKGELLDGTVFDEPKDPVEYKVNQLIGAWKEIMLELKKGGKAFLIAPPQLGYGTHDLNDIPANSIIVFNLEVVDVK